MKEKLCLFCKNFYLDMGSPNYSELTIGDDASIECLKNHWEMDMYQGTAEYRKNMLSANTCVDFELIDIDS